MRRPPSTALASGTARAPLALALSVAAAATLACQRDEVTHFRVAKARPAAAALAAAPGVAPVSAAAPAGGSGPMAGDVPAPPRPDGTGALRWTLPAGWKEAVAGGMRYATLTPPTPGRVEVSVVVLSGAAGGELANVNRWRGQIGLPPLAEPELAAARQQVRARAGPVTVYDFTSEGSVRSRVVAGLASAAGNTWFIKMSGDADPVGSARPAFIHLLESLHFDGT